MGIQPLKICKLGYLRGYFRGRKYDILWKRHVKFFVIISRDRTAKMFESKTEAEIEFSAETEAARLSELLAKPG